MRLDFISDCTINFVPWATVTFCATKCSNGFPNSDFHKKSFWNQSQYLEKGMALWQQKFVKGDLISEFRYIYWNLMARLFWYANADFYNPINWTFYYRGDIIDEAEKDRRVQQQLSSSVFYFRLRNISIQLPIVVRPRLVSVLLVNYYSG